MQACSVDCKRHCTMPSYSHAAVFIEEMITSSAVASTVNATVPIVALRVAQPGGGLLYRAATCSRTTTANDQHVHWMRVALCSLAFSMQNRELPSLIMTIADS